MQRQGVSFRMHRAHGIDIVTWKTSRNKAHLWIDQRFDCNSMQNDNRVIEPKESRGGENSTVADLRW
jgi:hypothetical protein